MNRRISSSSASAAIIEQVCGEIATRLYVSIAGKLKVAYAKVTVGIIKTKPDPFIAGHPYWLAADYARGIQRGQYQ